MTRLERAEARLRVAVSTRAGGWALAFTVAVLVAGGCIPWGR